MGDELVQSLIRQLLGPDVRLRGIAIRQLASLGEEAKPALPNFFELTFDANPPLRSDCKAAIKRLGSTAVPFLLKQAKATEFAARARAIELLIEAGGCHATRVRLAEQILGPRTASLPDWGTHANEVIDVFLQSLSDRELAVRHAGAEALEEFSVSVSQTIPIFIDVLTNSNDIHEKNWAALRLGRIGPTAKPAIPALAALATSSDRYARLAATNAIERISR